MSDESRPDKPQVDDLLQGTDMQRKGTDRCYVSPEAKAASQSRVAGDTNFEPKNLEEMLAMVDDAKPSDLETASTDLWTAAGKIKEIGEEIKKGVDKVGWEGEFGETFTDWGHKLGRNIVILADYTENASRQLAAAGEGLSQVQSAMPKPDPSYANAPRLDAIPSPAKVDTNPTYEAAKKKEKDRGEAIQQMNRLASYYKVSRENMGSAPEPKFGTAPDMGFPPAPLAEAPRGIRGGETGVGSGSYSPSLSGGSPVQGTVPGDPGTSTPQYSPNGVAATPVVGTELNSVAPLLPAPVDKGPTVVNGPVNSGSTQGPTVVTGPGYQGSNRGPGNSRASGPSQGTSKNHAGVNHGLPRSVTGSGGTPTGRTAGPGVPPVGRNPGIVGGTPQSAGGQGASPRLPRGTVVGGEHGMTGRPPMGMGGGAGPAGSGTGSQTPGRRLASTPGGVVGNPRQTPLPGAAARPFTPGGTGLATNGSTARPMGMVPRTGPASPGERSRNNSERPDYLTEDEETWATNRDGHVPPVVD